MDQPQGSLEAGFPPQGLSRLHSSIRQVLATKSPLGWLVSKGDVLLNHRAALNWAVGTRGGQAGGGDGGRSPSLAPPVVGAAAQ